MKLCILLAFSFPSFSPLSGAIIFTEVNERISPPSTPPFLEYDLDEDGEIDWGLALRAHPFALDIFQVTSPRTSEFIFHVSGVGGVAQEIAVLREGDLIGSSLTSASHQWFALDPTSVDPMLSGSFDNVWLGPFVGEVAYLGISFESEGNTHYAWALVEGGGPGVSRGVISYAWETEPGVAIRAGAIPEPSSTGLLLVGMIGIFTHRRRR